MDVSLRLPGFRAVCSGFEVWVSKCASHECCTASRRQLFRPAAQNVSNCLRTVGVVTSYLGDGWAARGFLKERLCGQGIPVRVLQDRRLTGNFIHKHLTKHKNFSPNPRTETRVKVYRRNMFNFKDGSIVCVGVFLNTGSVKFKAGTTSAKRLCRWVFCSLLELLGRQLNL